EILADPEMPWTLDGEYQPGAERIVIENKNRAIRILTPKPKLPVSKEPGGELRTIEQKREQKEEVQEENRKD
ncbi:MAG: hypothetical protein PUC44_01520, partial [Eubacteriales bacterium]|nr:hypothetical protein [Eubacteriales bacterium]